MRKELIVLFILISVLSNAQFDKNFATEYESFQFVSKPNINSHLSKYLERFIKKKDLRSIQFTSKGTTFNKTVRLTFNLNKKGQPTNFRIRTGNSALDKRIKTYFGTYPLEELNINRKERVGKYSVQLFSREKGKTIIKASTIAVYDLPPIPEGCQNSIKSFSFFKDGSTSCLYKKLNEHIVQNISQEVFKKYRLKKIKEIKIYPIFSVDLEGNIFNLNELHHKFKSYKNRRNYIPPPKAIQLEVLRLLKTFPKFYKPATRNGNPIYYDYDTMYILTVEKK